MYQNNIGNLIKHAGKSWVFKFFSKIFTACKIRYIIKVH